MEALSKNTNILIPTDSSRQNNSNLTNVKIPKELANLIRIYCLFNNRKITEFLINAIENELGDFRERLERMKKI